jgi:hypothetical protein
LLLGGAAVYRCDIWRILTIGFSRRGATAERFRVVDIFISTVLSMSSATQFCGRGDTSLLGPTKSNPARFRRMRREKSGASSSVTATGLMHACRFNSAKGKLPAKFPPR